VHSTGLLITRVQKDSTGGVYVGMETRVKDLTVGELQSLITDTIKGALEDVLEDIAALSSDEYLHAIEEARNDYKTGNVKRLEDLFDV
jgi:hypothetical protein